MKLFQPLIATAAAAALLSSLASVGLADHHKESDGKMMEKKTIVQTAAGAEDFSTLVAAVKAGGLAETLSGEGPFTVFAPTNDAFAALPDGTVEMLLKPENKQKLSDILTYHVVEGKVDAKMAMDLDGQMVETVNGEMIEITVSDGKVMVNGAEVVMPDIMASNGIIHGIDAVVMPPMKEKKDKSGY